jgi:hypothetical protein
MDSVGILLDYLEDGASGKPPSHSPRDDPYLKRRFVVKARSARCCFVRLDLSLGRWPRLPVRPIPEVRDTLAMLAHRELNVSICVTTGSILRLTLLMHVPVKIGRAKGIVFHVAIKVERLWIL